MPDGVPVRLLSPEEQLVVRFVAAGEYATAQKIEDAIHVAERRIERKQRVARQENQPESFRLRQEDEIRVLEAGVDALRKFIGAGSYIGSVFGGDPVQEPGTIPELGLRRCRSADCREWIDASPRAMYESMGLCRRHLLIAQGGDHDAD